MKTRQDNNVIDRISAIYAKNDNDLLWPIKPSVVYDENKRGQWRHWLYRWVCTEKDIELLWSIGFGADGYENKIGQLRD